MVSAASHRLGRKRSFVIGRAALMRMVAEVPDIHVVLISGYA